MVDFFEYTKEGLEEEHWKMIAEIHSLKSQLKKARKTNSHYYQIIQSLEEEIEGLG